MVYENRYIKKFAKPDPRAVTQTAFEKVLDEKYSNMSFDDVVAELSYLTVRDREELSGQLANLKRSYYLGRTGRFFRRHDNLKFKIMYREWKSQQPVVPL